MSFPILMSSHWTDHFVSAAIIYVLQSHTSLSGITPASQRKMLMTSLHFAEPHLFLGICILILLWLVEVLGFFCGHMLVLTQSIEIIFAGPAGRMTPVWFVIKDIRHISLYLFTKANKISWMPGDIFIIWLGGGSLCEYKSEFIHWSPCFYSSGFLFYGKSYSDFQLEGKIISAIT